jgi:hypothetical protein
MKGFSKKTQCKLLQPSEDARPTAILRTHESPAMVGHRDKMTTYACREAYFLEIC